MRRCHTAPMMLCGELTPGSFALEPYEAGWASEAMALVYVRDVHGPAVAIKIRAQVSADGARWVDFERAFPSISKAGGYFMQLSGFGNWLRLAGDVVGGAGTVFLTDIYWVLK